MFVRRFERRRGLQCRWVPAALVAAVAGASGLAGMAPAAAGTGLLVNCAANPATLQPAINAASPGGTLQVKGSCIGPFTIGKNLTLNGGRGGAVLNGNAAGSTVTVSSGAQVRLFRLTVTNGSASRGGGIYNQGTLTVSGSTVSNNTAPDQGGGIYNQGTLTLSGSTLSNNTGGSGGGTTNVGMLTVNGSVVRGNHSVGAGGGINNNGSLIVRNSEVFGNSGDHGGGIFNFLAGHTATITNSAVHDNIATALSGGGIGNQQGTVTVTSSHVYSNTAPHGGGLGNDAGTMNVSDTAVEHNTAPSQGGGLYNGGTVKLARSTVGRNTAGGGPGSGGGIYNTGTVTSDRSMVAATTRTTAIRPAASRAAPAELARLHAARRRISPESAFPISVAK